MANPALTTRLKPQGKALVRTSEPLATINASGPFDPPLSDLSLAAYGRLLRSIVAVAAAGGERVGVWVTENK